MAKTASAIDVPLVRRRSYDTGTFLNPLGTPLRKGFDVRALDYRQLARCPRHHRTPPIAPASLLHDCIMVQMRYLYCLLPRSLHSVARLWQFICHADQLQMQSSSQHMPHFDDCMLPRQRQRVPIGCALDPVEIHCFCHHFSSANQTGHPHCLLLQGVWLAEPFHQLDGRGQRWMISKSMKKSRLRLNVSGVKNFVD